MQKISIALLDPQILFRKGIAALLQQFENYDICYEAGSGTELMNYLLAGALPQVVLTAVMLPGQSGYEVTLLLKQQYPSIKVIALSAIYSQYAVWRMVACGACGFITKATSPQHLLQVLSKASHPDFECGGFGGLYAQRMLPPEVKNAHLANTFHFNETEMKFLQLCCTQMSYKHIAQQLKTSEKGVEKMRDRLCEKLDLKTRQQLAVFTVTNGLRMDLIPLAC